MSHASSDHTTTPSERTEREPYRYSAALASDIERKWQDRWEADAVFHTPNPSGDLSAGFQDFAEREKLYVLDMFPYPSGVGLHVGHPLGYIATDIFARFKRMTGCNVLHAMGYDAFGLPAEQYAVQTGTHPRVRTEENIANMRRQLRRLGLGHDPRRSVSTTDVPFYRWTQWIFLQVYNSWFDAERDAARPIQELIDEFESGSRAPVSKANPHDAPWSALSEADRRRIVDSYRLAYLEEAPVNWCPQLGTVLANEEVTGDGRSERGNFPVFKRPLKQWMMRITRYAQRLLDDLDSVDWPEPVKMMQRNWIGRSAGAFVDFHTTTVDATNATLRVFTTRPDTLFGATYMVLAPEHPLVDSLVPGEWPAGIPEAWKGRFPGAGALAPKQAVEAYRRFAEARTDVQRQADEKDKTGVFTGAYAVNPVNGESVPIFIADYVLMGYGTGAIMAVPAHDERDFAFAQQFELPIIPVYEPASAPEGETLDGFRAEVSSGKTCFTGDGVMINSGRFDGLSVSEGKAAIVGFLEEQLAGTSAVTYKLRDWLFSRQRYWGEPFPIVYDTDGNPRALPESMLPVKLPDLENFQPESSDDPDAPPRPPLGRASDWAEVELDLGDGPAKYRRELNTMPQWAGSCWYFLRYLDPTNHTEFVAPANERYWMKGQGHNAGGVDLYVGGVEHAVLHLLYARFWHKVLFDLGHVSTPEPFQRLYNQGYIQAFAYTDERGVYVEADEVVDGDGRSVGHDPGAKPPFFHEGKAVHREYGKMGKSLKNAVAPDEICESFGADTLRLYEMYLGPLDQSKPWNTDDIIGVHRFLQRLWRNVVDEQSGALRVSDDPADDDTLRLLHKTIAGVRDDMTGLRFNTAIAKLIEFNNALTKLIAKTSACPRAVAEALALMLAPLAPHVAEELWERLGHGSSLAHEAFPVADESLLVADTVEIAVQLAGKVKARIHAPADADAKALEAFAMAHEDVAPLVEGKTVRKVIAVPGRLVNIIAN